MTPPVDVQTDFDLHGIVGIRLLDARPAEIAMITRQLGSIQRPLSSEPDITIRFVDALTTASRMTLLGIDDAGFTDDAFFVLRGKHKSQIKVQIPFADIGQRRCDIVAERGLPAVPLLLAIVNLTAIAQGVLPLHASAFEYNGTGALVTGWSKGGKSETLLAFTANGARYVGDEWIYLSADGQRMYGIPEPMRLWKWHLDEMPQYQAAVPRSDRLKLRALELLTRTVDRVGESRIGHGSAPLKLLRRVSPVLKRQLNVQVPPKRLFGDAAGSISGVPQKFFFVASHAAPDIAMQRSEAVQIARRMVFSLEEERADFMAYYRKFRFAFPEARNELIETLEDRQREMLMAALAHIETWEVYHPYPVSIPLLYDAMLPAFQPS
jgi:hypothetical protein